jgi:hypothetical protein
MQSYRKNTCPCRTSLLNVEERQLRVVLDKIMDKGKELVSLLGMDF